MRAFLRDAFVRRFISGFTFGLIAFAAVHGYQSGFAAHADPATAVETISAR